MTMPVEMSAYKNATSANARGASFIRVYPGRYDDYAS